MNIRSTLVLLAFILCLLFSWWYYIYIIKAPNRDFQLTEQSTSGVQFDTSNVFCPNDNSIAHFFTTLKPKLNANQTIIFKLDQLANESDEDFAKRYSNFDRIAGQYLDKETFNLIKGDSKSKYEKFDNTHASFDYTIKTIDNQSKGRSEEQDYTINTTKVKGTSWPLKRLILFNNSDDIDTRRRTKRLLEKYVVALQNSTDNIILIGRTDNRGLAETGMIRAERLKSFFIEQGIDSERITLQSYGSKCPIASNMTKEGRKYNNCVEICRK